MGTPLVQPYGTRMGSNEEKICQIVIELLFAAVDGDDGMDIAAGIEVGFEA